MEPEKKSNGALVGLIIIILILVIGGLYMWQSSKTPAGETAPSDSVSASDSTELDALGQELDVTDVDVGANAIDSVQ
ncbi:MAG: hypothetical protein WCT44_01025 [Candidatus Paceibacterota bacterium]